MGKRTVLNFQAGGDVWPVVEMWAKERDFREKTRGPDWRRYQQGNNLLVLPKMAEVRQQGNQVQVQAWVRNPVINRIMTLFLMPSERDLGKGTLWIIPRSTARRDLNILLQRLGQPAFDINKK